MQRSNDAMRIGGVLLIALALPVAAWAQAPAPRSPQSAFAGALAENLSNTLAEVATLQQQVQQLQAELAKIKAPPAADAPK